MAKPIEYDNDSQVTMANEPAVAYQAVPTAQTRVGIHQSTTPPPCQYTEEEVVQRVQQATADVDAGRGLVSHEEFKKQVRSWLN